MTGPNDSKGRCVCVRNALSRRSIMPPWKKELRRFMASAVVAFVLFWLLKFGVSADGELGEGWTKIAINALTSTRRVSLALFAVFVLGLLVITVIVLDARSASRRIATFIFGFLTGTFSSASLTCLLLWWKLNELGKVPPNELSEGVIIFGLLWAMSVYLTYVYDQWTMSPNMLKSPG